MAGRLVSEGESWPIVGLLGRRAEEVQGPSPDLLSGVGASAWAWGVQEATKQSQTLCQYALGDSRWARQS